MRSATLGWARHRTEAKALQIVHPELKWLIPEAGPSNADDDKRQLAIANQGVDA
jgi:hypothetical protein